MFKGNVTIKQIISKNLNDKINLRSTKCFLTLRLTFIVYLIAGFFLCVSVKSVNPPAHRCHRLASSPICFTLLFPAVLIDFSFCHLHPNIC